MKNSYAKNRTRQGCGIPGTTVAASDLLQGIPVPKAPRFRCSRTLLSVLGAITLLGCGHSASALSVDSLGQGLLPTGDLVWTVRFTVSKGDVFPWHYHTGKGWAIVVSGVLTEDEGCGTERTYHRAGSAFAEEPGHVHMAFNEFDDDVVIIWTEIFPACLPNTGLPGTVFVSGPECEGSSGTSRLVKIPDCP